MRAVIQRVTSASVTVDGTLVGAVGRPGLCVLVGVTHGDDETVAVAMATKVAGLRILRGEQGVAEAGAPVLVVSQFTLYGDTTGGRRPSWKAAAPATVAEPLVDAVAAALRALGVEVAMGRFGADMALSLVNDGPVTLVLDVP